jgi:hypothetical protein
MRTLGFTLLLAAALSGAPALADDDAEERILELIEESVASHRRSTLDRTGTPKDEEDRRAMAKVYRAMEGRRVTVNFDRTPFKDCVDFIRDVSGLNIVVSQQVRELAEDEGIEVTLRLKDLKLRNCFELFLKQADKELRYGIRHGVLFIALADEWEKDEMILQMLPIGDLLHRPPDFPGPKMGIGDDGVEFRD